MSRTRPFAIKMSPSGCLSSPPNVFLKYRSMSRSKFYRYATSQHIFPAGMLRVPRTSGFSKLSTQGCGLLSVSCGEMKHIPMTDREALFHGSRMGRIKPRWNCLQQAVDRGYAQRIEAVMWPHSGIHSAVKWRCCAQSVEAEQVDEAQVPSYLDRLNSEQIEAVTAPVGRPIRLLAGPGSGKTRVLTTRVAHLVLDQNVSPWDIMCITFTNKAANEIDSRLSKLMTNGENKFLTVGTFHSVAARMLRTMLRYPVKTSASATDNPVPGSGLLLPSDYIQNDWRSRLGINSNFTIYDQNDTTDLIKKLIAENSPTAAKNARQIASDIRNSISTWKNGDDIDFDNLSDKNYFEKILSGYERALRKANAVDFDDLLALTVEVLKREPRELERWQTRYRHVLVDEFQDTSNVQFELVMLLAQRHSSVFVVGDPNQAIYSWRGARVDNILKGFETRLPSMHHLVLRRNHRNTRGIQAAAAALVADGSRNIQEMVYSGIGLSTAEGEDSVRTDWAGISVGCFEREALQAKAVASVLKRMHREGSIESTAVLYRINRLARGVESVLLSKGIPYVVVGGLSFTDRRVIKDMLAFLRLVSNPRDDAALTRVINVPPRHIGIKALESLRKWAADQQKRDTALEMQDQQKGGPASGLEKKLEIRNEIDQLMDKWSVELTASCHVASAPPTRAVGARGRKRSTEHPKNSWVVILMVAHGGLRSQAVACKDIVQRLAKQNAVEAENPQSKGPWRVAAVLSGFQTKDEATAVEVAWKSVKKEDLPAQFVQGSFCFPEGSKWGKLPAVLRRTQQLACLQDSDDANLAAVLDHVKVSWTSNSVLLTDAPSTAGAAPPLLRPGATTFSANDRNLIDRATNATNTVEFASIASALANLDSDQLPSKEEMGLTVRAWSSLGKLHTLLRALRAKADRVSVSELVDELMEELQYKEYLASGKTKKKEVKSSDEEDQDVEMNLWLIESLKDMATGIAEKEENSHDDLGLVAEAQHDVSEKSRNAEWGSPKDVIERTPLEKFLEMIALASSTDVDIDNKVKLMTIHAAKGLEFETVFVIGCNEGIIPVSWSKDVVNGGGVEEEKRLFYVALTRASQRLFISYTMNPDDERDVPSSFLSNLRYVLKPVADLKGETSEMTSLRKASWQLMQTWL